MTDRDFAAWIAVRSIASAVSKLRQSEAAAISATWETAGNTSLATTIAAFKPLP